MPQDSYYSQLYTYLRSFYEISQEDFELLQDKFFTKTVKKGVHLLSPEQTQKELYFVKKGVQMSYFSNEIKDYVVAFTYPPSICAVPESFLLQKPSQCYLTCLSETEVACIGFHTLQELFDVSRNLERLFRKMTELVLAGIINRHIELHSLSIEERFKTFCLRSPHLLQLVPHKYIASYLGIDPTNFSKLYNSVKL